MKKLSMIILMTCSMAAQAHEAWVALEGPAHAIYYGHLDKPERNYDAAKIGKVAAYDANGKSLAVELDRGAAPATLRANGAAVLLLDFDNGYWSKTVEGSKPLPKNRLSGVLSSARSLKYGKTLLVWSAAAQRTYGQRLEIVPGQDEAPAAGEPLRLRVLFEGKPLANATVQLEGYKRPEVKTDAEGFARVELGQSGMQVIVAGHERPLNSPEADTEKHSANLVFMAR